MKLHPFIFFSIFLLLFATCEDGESLKKKNESNELLFLVSIQYIRSLGNCKRIETQENSGVITTTCSRTPSGVCNVESLFYTQADLSYSIREGRDITNVYPECFESFIQSGIPNLKITTEENKTKMRTLNQFVVVESCEMEGLSLPSNERLATYHEIQFLESPKGKIGLAAKFITGFALAQTTSKANANQCLDKVFSQKELELITSVQTNSVYIQKNL
ncbi:hypothetical protein P3G55_03410 [Leptospira sp. 96542]|nr:hypothetical protein [Leptospira sp. 96542]